jgi:hypothetical protein
VIETVPMTKVVVPVATAAVGLLVSFAQAQAVIPMRAFGDEPAWRRATEEGRRDKGIALEIPELAMIAAVFAPAVAVVVVAVSAPAVVVVAVAPPAIVIVAVVGELLVKQQTARDEQSADDKFLVGETLGGGRLGPDQRNAAGEGSGDDQSSKSGHGRSP